MTQPKVQFANANDTLVFVNELTVGDDGWAMIAPLGDHPGMALGDGGKKFKAIQRIDKEAIATMANEFAASRKGVKKYFSGRPIYVGHPDVPGYESRYPDKSPKGMFSNIEARADGLYGMPVFTNEGSELVESRKLRALSGRWSAEPAGEVNGVPVFRPSLLISAGLTNQPNLPVQLLNESETTPVMLKEYIELLQALGITIANDATEAQAKADLAKAKTAAAERATLVNEKSTLAASVAAKDTEITKVKGERDSAATSFSNERKARVDGELGRAVKEGRITEAERATWNTRLGAEATFANELTALNALPPKVHTTSVTLTRGERRVELVNAGQRAEMVNELIDEVCKEKGWDRSSNYAQAYHEVQKRHAGLFEAMTAPALNGKARK